MASYLESIATITILFVVTITIGVYAYFKHSYQYWKKKKIPYLEPVFPRGNNPQWLTKTFNVNLNAMDFYDQIENRGWKFAGVYVTARPVLVVTDPEHIKDILVKDFDHFIDRGFYYNERKDPISAHLFALDSTKWRDMRVKLTPTFTSGKIKMMFPMMLDVSHNMMRAIDKKVDGGQNIDIKEFLARFTTDVIGTCAFGIDCNSFKNPDAEFRRVGQKIFTIQNLYHLARLIFISNAPELALKMGIKGNRKDVSDFFHSTVDNMLKYRQENNVRRSDFLQLLIDLMNNTRDSNKPFTTEQLISQVFLFFIAGFDTSSSAINFALYELARQPDIQEKLRDEIHSVVEKDDGKLTYDNINKMHYLQQVIDETLRIYPSVPLLQRRCVKQYTMRGTDSVIEKGTKLIIPIISMQRDPKYFPDPLKFDPERFSVENKKQRNPILHIPFGEGPRNCIGLRFGLLQTKIALVQILGQYRVSISPSTKMPLTLDRQSFLIKSEETLYLLVQIIQCYCEGHCPFGDTRGICQITSPGGKCYAAVFFEKDEDGEEFPKVAFGCQPDAQMAMLQCKGSLIPHHLNKNAIECCDDGDFCNKDVFAEYAAAPSDPWWPHAPPLHLALFLLLALSLAAALAAAAVLLVKYRRAVARFRGGAANEEEGRAAKEEEGRLAGVGRAVGEGQPPRAAAAGKLAQLIEQSSGSGKGLPLMVQRTIAKQIEMERIVGRGRYGEVWLAKWRGERVAAKIFHSMDEKSWIRETAVYQSVLMRHENLLGFIAADIKGTGWTQMLLITDYHEKGSLFDYLRTYSLNPDSLVTLSWSISRGLTHLHTEIHGVHGKPSIAHRDIKSKNILVKDNGECCIADFGLAVQFEANTNNINLPETNVKSGTKRYMAPEILDGTMETQNFESHKMADIYAFALVLWEMSTRCAFGSHEAMPYQIPYHDAVPSDPTFEQMCQLVCVEKARPKIPTTWTTHETMNIIMKTMQEMWHEYPGARLTALRIKKTLSRLKPSKDNSQPS